MAITRRPLRVALVAPSRHPLRRPFLGGMEAMVWNLARGLRAEGVQTLVVAPEGSDFLTPGLELDGGGWSPSDLALADRYAPPAGFLREHHAYLRAMTALARADVDVVHNHSLHHLPISLAETLPCPLVTTLHTPPIAWMESAFEVAGARAGEVTAVSRATADSWCLDRAPCVVPNGVDLRLWRPGPGGDDVVWSGRITPEKAPHDAIHAAARAGLAIRLAGPVDDPVYFAERIRPLLGPRTTYVGHLAAPALAELVGRSAVALVTPHWPEPFGLVVAEALACGTPVVAYACGGIAETLTDPAVGRLVRPGDVDALSGALREATRLSRARVRAFAEEHLSLDLMVARYLELYAHLVRQRTPSVA